ncbi:hypothetical protein ACQ4M3_13010 [Leptolyngbya sp. AN03gr2]|uniref:hypothetical protein n=1 Tax=unclassified Leptolyngbya TaxID=2650499 RepID=UPI003D310915
MDLNHTHESAKYRSANQILEKDSQDLRAYIYKNHPTLNPFAVEAFICCYQATTIALWKKAGIENFDIPLIEYLAEDLQDNEAEISEYARLTGQALRQAVKRFAGVSPED